MSINCGFRNADFGGRYPCSVVSVFSRQLLVLLSFLNKMEYANSEKRIAIARSRENGKLCKEKLSEHCGLRVKKAKQSFQFTVLSQQKAKGQKLHPV